MPAKIESPPASVSAGFFLLNPCNPDPVAIRSAMGLSQTKFAQLIRVSVRTLHQ